MKSLKVVLGMLAGAVTGALAGILFAPAKGSKTRKKIVKQGEGYVDSLKEKFENVKEEVIDYAETEISQPQEPEKDVKKAKA